MFLIQLKQENKAGQVVFSAEAKFNLVEGKEFQSFGREVANFAKETISFQQRSKERGLNVSMIRKTLPTSISIKALDDNDDLAASLYFRNFGAYVAKVGEGTLAEQLADSAEFTYKFSGWNK